MNNKLTIKILMVFTCLLLITLATLWTQNINGQKTSMTETDISNIVMKNLTIKNNLQKYGIEVLSSSDFNFKTELVNYVGNDERLLSLVDSTKPFVFFIKNNSSKEVVGVSLRWRFNDSNGKSLVIPQSEANPGILMGIKPLDPNMVGKTSLINSKEIKFFSYFKDFVEYQVAYANMRIKNSSINYGYSGSSQFDLSNLNLQKEKFLDSYTDFSVTIDGIFFADGTFVGADENLFFDTLRGTIQARKDFLTDLIKAKTVGKKDSETLDDILSKTSKISVNSAELQNENATSKQVFDYSYNLYLKNLRSELVMKRSKMSDDYIVKQLQSGQTSEFVTLRKIKDDSK